MTGGSKLALALMLSACAAGVRAETATVRGRVEVARGAKADESKSGKAKGETKSGETRSRNGAIPATVVWLTPAAGSGIEFDPPKPNEGGNPRLVQKNKSFE